MGNEKPTSYLKVKEDHPDAHLLKGPFNAEFNAELTGPRYCQHLARPDSERLGKPRTRHGRGDIVVEGLSRYGAEMVFGAVGSADTELEVMNAVYELDFLSPRKIPSDTARANAIAAARRQSA